MKISKTKHINFRGETITRWHIEIGKRTMHSPTLWLCVRGWFIMFIICMASIANAQTDSTTTDTTKHKKTDWVYHSLEASYIALNTADVLITYKGLEKGLREANPFIQDIIDNKPLFIGIKAVFTFGALALIRQVRKHDRKTGMIYLIGANVLYSVVVAHNYSVVIRF